MNISNLNLLKNRTMYRYLFVLSICMASTFQAWRTLFNNFSVGVVNLDSDGIGIIQSIREIPGFLALLVVYIYLLIKEHRVAAIGVGISGIGVFLTGLFPTFSGVIITTLVMSFGFHYYETVNQSLTLQYFNTKESPFVFAYIKKYSSLVCIITGLIIWAVSDNVGYTAMYMIFGGISVIGSVWAFTQKPTEKQISQQHKKIVLRKKYWAYYVLTFLSGARRQIFVVFAVFLMVKKFNFSLQTITLLFVLNNVINFFWLPQIAKLIDKLGEKKVLIIEYVGMVFIFLAYAYTNSPIVVGVLYIIDNIFFNFSLALKTYFHKIADKKDIAPSSGVSFTINHIAAVVIPFVGGQLWLFDYRIPFYMASVLGLLSVVLSLKIPSKKDLEVI